MRAPSHADYQAQRGLPMKAALDADITELLASTDEAARRDLYRKVLTTLHEQAVYLPLSYMTNLVLYREGLKGVRCGFTTYEIPFEEMSKQ